MITFTYAELDAFLATFIYPTVRILGLLSVAPLFNSRTVPARIRLLFGLIVSLAIAPALPPAPAPEVGSGLGLVVMAQNYLIGLAMGFVMRLVFAAVDVAGEMMGLQMGLSFAVFFDPEAGGQTAVLTEFLGLLAMLVFLTLNGHLLMIDVLVRSFEWLPAGGSVIRSDGFSYIARLGSVVYASGLLLALPLVAALLISNVAMGILTRAAPQLNLFAVGFPITLTMGFFGLSIVITAFAPVMSFFFEQGIAMIDTLLVTMKPAPP